jgi:Domain of unknown function (DUF4259)
MAIDGADLFQNDAAYDFLERVADGSGVSEVRRALREVIDHPTDYLDVDIAAEAWVAAELVAARAGEARQRTGYEPDSYDAAIASLPVDPALLEDSLRVRRAANGSQRTREDSRPEEQDD